eukprot:scaffold6179_cov50-Phaeocystis_antarctica.AAC.1
MLWYMALTTCGAPHGTRCIRHGRGLCAYGVRTVRGALGASCPVPPCGTQEAGAVRRPRGVRVSIAHHRVPLLLEEGRQPHRPRRAHLPHRARRAHLVRVRVRVRVRVGLLASPRTPRSPGEGEGEGEGESEGEGWVPASPRTPRSPPADRAPPPPPCARTAVRGSAPAAWAGRGRRRRCEGIARARRGLGAQLATQAIDGVWGRLLEHGEADRVNCDPELLLQIVPLCICGRRLVPVGPRVRPAQEVRKLFERVFWATRDDVRDAGAQLISPGAVRHSCALSAGACNLFVRREVGVGRFSATFSLRRGLNERFPETTGPSGGHARRNSRGT